MLSVKLCDVRFCIEQLTSAAFPLKIIVLLIKQLIKTLLDFPEHQPNLQVNINML